MTLPANLFVDTPEMEDVSLHQLGNDTEAWPEEIIQKVKERLPHAAAGSVNLMVKFMKKDDENGTATGSITAHSANKSAIIPLIIKDFMMYPLDVFIASGKLLPLTPTYFDAAFSSNELFDKIEEYPTFGGLGRFEDANLWNAIYPPSLGRYAYAAAGDFPILNSLDGTLDGTEFAAYLRNPENAKIAARLLSGPHREVIQKLANTRPVNMNEFRQGVDNLIPRSIAVLRREGPNKYSILSNSDSVFHPGITHMDRCGINHALSESGLSDHAEDDINDVDQNGEKYLILPKPKNDVILAKEDTEVPESANEFDRYVVKTKTGVSVEGVVIPHVIDFNQKKVDLKIFLGKTMSTIQPEIYGVRVKNSRFKPAYQIPKVGQTGTFVYQPDASHGIATVPVTVKSVAEHAGMLMISAHDLMGRPIKFHVEPKSAMGLARIAPLAPGLYAIPHAMKWAPMEDMSEVTNSVDDYAVKQAGLRKTDWPVSVVPTGHGFYAMRGVDKYASAAGWDKGMLDASQVRFLLTSLGAPQEKIATAFKHATKYGRAEFHNLNRVPLTSEKVAKARPIAVHLVKVAKSLKRNLFKEASQLQVFVKKGSYLENSQTVDALLSLNFINPNNVSKYISRVPALKAAISHLASCLIASRLGMKEIPELAASTAMTRLVEVVDGLEKLKATTAIQAQQG